MALLMDIVLALAAASDSTDGMVPRVATDAFFIFIVSMTACAVLLLLVLVVLMAVRMGVIMRRLDEISDSANQFLAMGVKFFKDKHRP